MDNKVNMGKSDLTDSDLSKESQTSIDIKISAEVEKIWINYDLDKNGTLEVNEVHKYLKDRCPHMPEDAIQKTFSQMDLNNDGHIDKQEMFVYVKALMS